MKSNVVPPHPRVACALTASASLSLAWATAAAAQGAVRDSARVTMPDLALATGQWQALLAMVVCGAVGAFASDLAADGGRLEWMKREENGWTLGFLGKLIVGSVAAVVVLTINPPDGAWSLIGTALAAGVGGEAILLAILASRRADRADDETRQVRDMNVRLMAASRARLQTLARVGATLEGGGGSAALKSARFRGPTGEGADGAGGPSAGEGMLKILADDFGGELSAFATAAVEARTRPGTILQRVRAILVEVLNRDDVDEAPLRDIGGDEPHRNMIVEELNSEFPRSRPSFGYGEVKASHTLDTLTMEVEGRQP